jgi:hypothetical protein
MHGPIASNDDIKMAVKIGNLGMIHMLKPQKETVKHVHVFLEEKKSGGKVSNNCNTPDKKPDSKLSLQRQYSMSHVAEIKGSNSPVDISDKKTIRTLSGSPFKLKRRDENRSSLELKPMNKSE